MKTTFACLAALGISGAPAMALAQPAIKPILDARLRYEQVDQDGLPETAQALTWRAHAGVETTPWRGLTGLVEVETVQIVGPEHFNVASATRGSLNGRTRYPAVNDPTNTELNRAQVTWRPGKAFAMTVGRQQLQVDDQRYIGSPSWRDDGQTFDAVRADVTLPRLTATYLYIARVNRNLQEDWRSDSQGLDVAYTFAEPLRLQGFVYALDFSNAPISSNKTAGVKVLGRVKLGATRLAYEASTARQTDYRGNSAPFSLGYREASLSATRGIWNAKLAYERLGGDGVRGFITPIAQAHAYQGWADAFSATGGSKTFVDGLEDLNLQVTVRPRWTIGPVHLTSITVRRHDFDNHRFGVAIGHELDAEAVFALSRQWNLGFKYADFQRAAYVPKGAATPPASRTKAMVYVEFKL